MYLSIKEKERLSNYCLEYKPYKYIERINYVDKCKTAKENYIDEDYIGIAVLPTLYITECTEEETHSGSGLFFADIKIIRHFSKEVCRAYLHDKVKPNTVLLNKPNSLGLHTLFIVKEIAYTVLEFMDLIVNIENPNLVKVYQSRKGFGDKIIKLSSDNNDFRYRVLKTISG